MIALLRHILDPSYLFAVSDTPLRAWSTTYLAWAGTLLAGALIARYWATLLRGQGMEDTAKASFWAFLSGLAAIGARVYATGALTARVWALSATVLGLTAPAIHWLARRPWPARRLFGRSLSLQLSPDDERMPLFWLAALVVAHAVGLRALAAEGLGWWPAGLVVACLLSAMYAQRAATGRRWGRCLRPEVSVPLLLPYGAVLMKYVLSEGLGVEIGPYEAFACPNPWAPWFSVPAMFLAGGAWMTITTGALVWRSQRVRNLPAGAWLGLATLGLGLAWYSALLWHHLSRGATGSDPFCYLQMTIDLALRGTARHDFPLSTLAREAGISLWPTVHVGYHPPVSGTEAATVWPVGWPALMVPVYMLAGERGLLWAAPACAVTSAWLALRLALETRAGGPVDRAWVSGGLAGLLVLTSVEEAMRSLVPMADPAAQALMLLTLLCLVRARSRDSLGWSVAAGAAFALSYFVRHPQLFLGLAAVPALLGAPWTRGRRARHLALFGATAIAVVIPDLAYHWAVLGAPWRSESPEWFLLSWRNIPSAVAAALREGLLGRREFGYLLAPIVFGMWRQWRCRQERVWASMMWTAFVGVLSFNLFYGAVRLRDFLSLSPLLSIWAARGLVTLWPRGGAPPPRRAVAVGLVLCLLAARSTWALSMPWGPQIWAFGHVTPLEASEYARLGALVPADAVVGTSVNSGAVELYAGHQAVRPAAWRSDEFASFAAALAKRGRSLYLLDDGQEIEQLIPQLREQFDLQEVSELVLPRFVGVSQLSEQPARLYTLELLASIRALPSTDQRPQK